MYIRKVKIYLFIQIKTELSKFEKFELLLINSSGRVGRSKDYIYCSVPNVKYYIILKHV